MATLSVGGGSGGKRPLDHDIPLIPFIDFLLCLVAFLLVTAVWSQLARLSATAKVPGRPKGPTEQRPALHVRVKEHGFVLEWRKGSTLLSQSNVERRARFSPDGQPRYPELVTGLSDALGKGGSRHSEPPASPELAVIHAPNALEYAHLAAVIDALHAPEVPGTSTPAFAVSFATN